MIEKEQKEKKEIPKICPVCEVSWEEYEMKVPGRKGRVEEKWQRHVLFCKA
jgi:hypothetical protein